MIKVLFVHDGPLYYDSDHRFYGVHYSDKIIERYLNLGSRVTFLIRTKKAEKDQLINLSLITNKSFSVKSFPNFKGISLFLKNKNKAKLIIENTVKEHDIIVIRMPSASGTIAFKMGKKLGKPCMVELVACTFDAYWNYDWRGKIIAHYKLLQQKLILKKASYVIYVTKEFLQKRYPTRGKSISCSNVALPAIKPEILERRIKKINSTDFSRPLVLGTIAALDVPYKAQKDIIKVIAKLRDEGKYYKYKLVGKGDSTVLQNAISKYSVENLVEIIGPLKHDEVFNFLDDIDIYIHPSKQEGLPRAVIEAMSRACPILGSDTAGIPELINTNYIFPKGSIKAIKNTLKNISKEELISEAKRNFETAKEYEKDKLEKKRLNFYREFLSDNGILD